MEDGDFLSEANASTIAMVLWFGTITFAATSMAARTWLLGDTRGKLDLAVIITKSTMSI
jgi:hypothetical protein